MNLNDLLLNKDDAIEAQVCVDCGESVEAGFDTPEGHKEYEISGLCERCQLRTFGQPEN